jgi:hypothetical protein
LIPLDGEALLSALDSPFVPSVVVSVCRRDDPGVTLALVLPDGDSPRAAFFEGLALAVAEALADGLADTEALAMGEAMGDALTAGEAVAVADPAVFVVAPVVVIVPTAPLTLVDVPTPTPAETP